MSRCHALPANPEISAVLQALPPRAVAGKQSDAGGKALALYASGLLRPLGEDARTVQCLAVASVSPGDAGTVIVV